MKAPCAENRSDFCSDLKIDNFLRPHVICEDFLFDALARGFVFIDRISRKGGKFRLPVKTPLLGPDVRISFFKDDGAFYLAE